MNYYPAWKNILVLAVLAIGTLIALPNIYGKAPSVQISRDDGGEILDTTINRIENDHSAASIAGYDTLTENGQLLIRFADVAQ